jgi:hypothetical protein
MGVVVGRRTAWGVELDTSRLAVEWVVVAVLGAAVYVLTRRREP